MNRRKLNRVWEKLRTLPMPAIASDRLVDLHNDVTDYDMTISSQMQLFFDGQSLEWTKVKVDKELEDSLRSFKVENDRETDCRRSLLYYKRRVDDVVRELIRLSS